MATTTTKQTGLYIIIALAILIAGVSIWYFFFKEDDKVEDPAKSNTPPPAGVTNWSKDSDFPLKKGMYGAKVKSWQEALIKAYGKTILPKYGADGKFGLETEVATQSKIGKPEVSKEEFDKLVGTSSSSSTSPKDNIGKKAFARVDNVNVYNADYTLYKVAKRDEWIGDVTGVAGADYKIVGNRLVGIGSVYFK